MTNQAFTAAEAQVTVLPNGVTVATIARPFASVFTGVFTRVGARYETEAENGISHFLEHMAFKGTNTRTSKDITFEIESIGANVNAYTSKNVTAYHVTGMPNSVGAAMEILADVLKNSTLSPNEIALEQEVVVAEIQESNDDIGDVAMQAFSALAYPDQPLGRSILGPKDNVRSFTQDMVRSYMDRNYTAKNLFVIGAGQVDHDEFVALAAAQFGDIEASDPSEVVPASYVGGTTVVEDDRYEQAQIFYGFPAPGVTDAGFLAYDLLGDLIGTGMSAPLFQEVREKRALCYSVQCGMMGEQDHSLFMVHGSTESKNIEAFMTASLAEIQKVADGVIEDADWTRAANQIQRRLLARSDSVSALARSTASDLMVYGRARSTSEILSNFQNVTREQVVAAAKAIVSSKATVVVAGNIGDWSQDNSVLAQAA